MARLQPSGMVGIGKITLIGGIQSLNWSSIDIPLPRSRLKGCSMRSPLAHFYIHHSNSSIRELHPFTTITHLASKNLATPGADDDFTIQFLFRKSMKSTSAPIGNSKSRFPEPFSRLVRGKEQRIRSTQWTQRLAGLVDQELNVIETGPKLAEASAQFPRVDVTVRLEGPYFSPADPFRYDKVICLVAGTGISGAIAIGSAFTELHRSPSNIPLVENPPTKTPNPFIPPWQRCIILWSVKATDVIEIPFLELCEGLEIRNCLTGPGRERIDIGRTIGEITKSDPQGRTWVYISGPRAYIDNAKSACKALGGLDWYAASWDI